MKKIVCLLLSLLVSKAFCATAAEALQAKLNTMRTMSADFQQVVSSKEREISRSGGTMALERPGRFRWQTKSPMEQIIVADGQELWVYDVDLEQATVKKQTEGLGGTAALFLSNYNDHVTRDFVVTVTGSAARAIFDLRAKSNRENFQRLKLIFLGNSLDTIEMFDQLGQHTLVKLNNVKNNPQLSRRLFQFKPPDGTDIIRQ